MTSSRCNRLNSESLPRMDRRAWISSLDSGILVVVVVVVGVVGVVVAPVAA